MSITKSMVEKILREKVKEKIDMMRLIKLPSKIIIEEKSNRKLLLSMSENCVAKNMQDDSAAFEAWILILKYWIGYDSFELSWVPCKNSKDHHYQRFLYRVYHFNKLFNKWFSISQESVRNMTELRIDFNSKRNSYVLNVPGDRKNKPPTNENSEAGLEWKFIHSKIDSLATTADLDRKKVDRQLPVGLFLGSKKKGNEIFPRGKSAIDVWGIGNNRKTLNIFELKKLEKNKVKVGIISELFFYTMIMDDARKGFFKFTEDRRDGIDPKKEINFRNIKKIHSYILAPELHPLVTKEVLEPLNNVLKGRGIRFGYIQFDKNLSCEKKW